MQNAIYGNMKSMMDPKEEWLKYGSIDSSSSDRWLCDRISSLFDVENPTPEQDYILHMASLRLTLMDLPSGAYRTHESELWALVEAEFGKCPERRNG